MAIGVSLITWILQKVYNLAQWAVSLRDQRKFERAATAWSSVDVSILLDLVTYYYEQKGVPLFGYPWSPTKVPLYVRQSWLNLTETSLEIHRSHVDRPVQLGKAEKDFLEIYPKVRQKLGLNELWNGNVFRLVSLGVLDDKLRLEFESGHFFDTLACQYLLEHEARLALSGHSKGKRVQPHDLPVRESLASTPSAVEGFCKAKAVRVGISNLILFRDGEDYTPAVRGRGGLGMGNVGKFDPISSGIFDISTSDPEVDFDLRYKVLKEVYEELCGGKDVEKGMPGFDPTFFFSEPAIKDLKQMLDDGRASFLVTGFCIDLVRLAPEITTLLVVRDGSYHAQYRSKFRINEEYGPASLTCTVPGNIVDVDEYLATGFPSDPARPSGTRGFDSSKWTLPGAFCFYQGLRRAVSEKLL